MKILVTRKGRWRGLLLAMSMLVLLWGGLALASSGAETHGADKHGEATHEGDAHKAKGWVATDTYRVMNFAVLAGALVFLLRKPLSQALDSRIKGIRTQLEDLEAKKTEAEKILSEYNTKIARLSQESEGIVAEYIRQGNDAKARILKEAEASAYKLEEQARRNIENEFEVAKQLLQQDIFEKAMIKAEEIIKKNITADDQNRLVDEYLDKVVA
ncbi:MAG: ATP synthase F0 subunit B [Deltaproteobacteria bacterium]|nr:ATP synthase F0 subunit B [Deltaproteobacteria bacterium]